MVIWITGLSGSGKTTLSLALRDLIKPALPHTVLIDGDTIRAAFGPALGYSEPERVIQIERIQKLAKILDEQDQIVVVAALYAHPTLLDWNRKNFQEYFEVYIQTSFELLDERDQKGLYSGARSGTTEHVVGFDVPWHEPETPDFIIEGDLQENPDTLARALIQKNTNLTGLISQSGFLQK
jgi:adenylylsulfate kinase-like enzyme